jgi:CBS domain-containing protein
VRSGGGECIGEKDTIADAASTLAELDVGAMPTRGEDQRLKGMLTDRDIVVNVIDRHDLSAS